MLVRLDELANKLSGSVLGDGSLTVSNALPLQDATEGHLTLLDSVKNIPRFVRSGAAAAIVSHQDSQAVFEQSEKPVIAVADLHSAFIQAISSLRPSTIGSYQGIDPRAIIDSTATIEANVYIGPNVVIGPKCHVSSGCRIHASVHLMDGCRLGEDCEIFPNAVLYPGTILGARVMLHACVVLGAYGFGYKLRNGRHERSAQLGWVEIENDVEIGANTTIDRGTYGSTRIGEGTKLDNQIQIGHNVHIGRHNLMCAQVGVAGSTSTGDYVVLGGQAGISDHVHVGDHVIAAAQSGIARNVEAHESVMGTPALSSRKTTQMWINTQRLPEMKKQLRELVASVASLQAMLAPSSEKRSKAA